MKNNLDNHIPVVEGLMSRQDLERHFKSGGGPLIIQGMVERWPAWKKWSLSWFKDTYSETTVPVESLKYTSGDGTVASRIGQVETMTIASYVDRLPSCKPGESGYIVGRDLFATLPGLLGDVEFPKYHDFDGLVERNMFIGGTGVYTQLHYDRAHNLHAMLQGQKRWQIYAPERTNMLKPLRYAFPWSVGSEYDVVEGDEFSLEAIASPENLPGSLMPDYDFYIDAGDVLVIPFGWWHRVLTTEDSIATNYWWWNYDALFRHAPGLVPEIIRDQFRKFFKTPTRRGFYEA